MIESLHQTARREILTLGKFLTTAEVCEELGTDGEPLTEGRVRQLISAGKLTAHKFGRANAFDAEEVAQLKSERQKQQKAASGKLKGGRPPKDQSN